MDIEDGGMELLTEADAANKAAAWEGFEELAAICEIKAGE